MEQKKAHGGSGRGQGRKAGRAEDRTKLRGVYLTDYQWDHCGREINSGGAGASEYVRRLIEADMRLHGKPLSPPDGWGDASP